MAVGGNRAAVLRFVLGGGIRLAMVGVVLGLVGAFGLTGFLGSFLFQVSPTDPIVFATVSVILIVVAMVASYIPAYRASRVDPLIASRQE